MTVEGNLWIPGLWLLSGSNKLIPRSGWVVFILFFIWLHTVISVARVEWISRTNNAAVRLNIPLPSAACLTPPLLLSGGIPRRWEIRKPLVSINFDAITEQIRHAGTSMWWWENWRGWGKERKRNFVVGDGSWGSIGRGQWGPILAHVCDFLGFVSFFRSEEEFRGGKIRKRA